MSATDANRFVLRFARHLTGRQRVAVMDWCYHGTVDETLAVLDGDRVVPRPGALGPQVDVAHTTAVVPFNDAEALDRRLAVGDIACLLMEPALTNIGIVLPEPGYLDAVREITRRHDVLLVIDETHTLCAGPGGATAAWGLEPDLLVVGKPIGGGVPAAAYGMSAEVADRLAGPMLGHEIDVAGVGGTLTGNALALAAIRATLSTCLRDEDFAVAIPLAERFAEGVAGVIAEPRSALARAAPRLPGRVLVLPSPARRRRRRCRCRRGSRVLPPPLVPQPGRPAHPVPQHGPLQPLPHRGRRRPTHPGLRRGSRGTARLTRCTALHPCGGFEARRLRSSHLNQRTHLLPGRDGVRGGRARRASRRGGRPGGRWLGLAPWSEERAEGWFPAAGPSTSQAGASRPAAPRTRSRPAPRASGHAERPRAEARGRSCRAAGQRPATITW